MGNIVNRVFDSSGPEGKVRGTPQQIIDKYLTLARDAQLSNDRVAAENFQQHAEHYARLLGEAQREIEAQRQQFGGSGDQRGERDDQRREDRDDRREERQDDRREDRRERKRQPETAEVIETESEEGAGLVETPEMRGGAPKDTPAEQTEPRRRSRRPRSEKTEQPPSPPSEAAE
ncbi:MAG: DUF4167 domain-containing protein [Paracoccaceae bacterium]|nr:DUF4167 domain-containing protein [Paracoccaceae bacterium]